MSFFSILLSGFGKGPKQKPQVIEGSRLSPESLLIQTSAWGQNIPYVFGRARIAGNIIWARDIREVRTETTTTSSTGTGKAAIKTTTTNINYEYYCSFAVAICGNEISDVLKIWADTKLIYNLDTTDGGTLDVTAAVPLVKYLGTETQIPSSIIEGYEGAGNVSGHRGIAYVVFDNLPLADFNNRIPNLSFEIQA
ncbi:MAG: hypothetical protein K2Q45_03040 [Nitrosomonas sp.]|nr:hypothetical protein [Nitrosomonas sp.]